MYRIRGYCIIESVFAQVLLVLETLVIVAPHKDSCVRSLVRANVEELCPEAYYGRKAGLQLPQPEFTCSLVGKILSCSGHQPLAAGGAES